MITDKRKLLLWGIGALLLVLTAVIVWVSILLLKQDDPEPPFELLTLEESGEAISECVLILPEDCSSLLHAETLALGEEIEAQTGVPYRVAYDSEPISVEKEKVYLLLGRVDDPFALRETKSLKRGDYLCKQEQNKILLGGKTNEATMAAILRFRQELLPHATAQQLLSPSAGVSFLDTNPVKSISLNGWDLNEYTVVYPAAEEEVLGPLAEAFCRRISDKSGYVLFCESASKDHRESRQIYLSLDSVDRSDSVAYIAPDGDRILLTAKDTYGISVAIREFCELLTQTSSQGVCNAVIDETKAVAYEKSMAKIASALTANSEYSNAVEVTEFLDTIWENQPSAVFLDELPRAEDGIWEENLSGYSFFEEACGHFLVKNGCRVTWHEESNLYQVGGENDGFFVLLLRQVLSAEERLDFMRMLEKLSLPLVLLVHGECAKDAASLAEEANLGAVFYDEGNFACYATEDAFHFTMGAQEDAICYVDLTAERKRAF